MEVNNTYPTYSLAQKASKGARLKMRQADKSEGGVSKARKHYKYSCKQLIAIT